MYAIELAVVLSQNDEIYSEKFDLVALPFIPRKNEQILWNGQLYVVTNIMYGFETSEDKYDFVISPEIQTAVASSITCKIWLEKID